MLGLQSDWFTLKLLFFCTLKDKIVYLVLGFLQFLFFNDRLIIRKKKISHFFFSQRVFVYICILMITSEFGGFSYE